MLACRLDNDSNQTLKALVKCIESFGLSVNLHTKARGNQGILVGNRIDVSRLLSKEAQIGVLVHEFAHFVHLKLEPDMLKTHGSLGKLFCVYDENQIEQIRKELIEQTRLVDKHARLETLHMLNDEAKHKVKEYDAIVKKYHPGFLRSKKFREFDKYIRHSKAKYLLKYDVVKFVTPFLKRVEIYSIQRLDKDFSDMPEAFKAYIKLRSKMRKQKRVSAKISNRKAYYHRPSELFARFVQGFYLNAEQTSLVAPLACERFLELLQSDYYVGLSALLPFGLNNKAL